MKKNKTAIILGRFQGSEMHEGYKALLKTATEDYENVVILLGSSPRKATPTDPLSVITRARLISDYLSARYNYPSEKLTFHKVFDMRDDKPWVDALDEYIVKLGHDKDSFVFLSGRDSFKDYYTPIGKFPDNFVEVPEVVGASSTVVRDKIKTKDIEDYDPSQLKRFAEGVIWATQQPYPRTDVTVDIAILHKTQLVLGRKPNEAQWRLPGGFFDLSIDKTIREAAARESFEETGIVLASKELEYVESVVVEDWRYRKGKDSVVTSLFMAQLDEAPTPIACDDLEEVKLIDILTLDLSTVVSGHRPLIQLILERLSC